RRSRPPSANGWSTRRKPPPTPRRKEASWASVRSRSVRASSTCWTRSARRSHLPDPLLGTVPRGERRPAGSEGSAGGRGVGRPSPEGEPAHGRDQRGGEGEEAPEHPPPQQ